MMDTASQLYKETGVAETAVFSAQVTSVHEPILLEKTKINIYPNPTRGSCTITLEDTSNAAIMQIGVYSILGSCVCNYEGPAQQAITVSLEKQPPGVYLVMMRNGQHVATQKLIRQ